MNRTHPQVWLLCGHKAGDNNQLLALAQALGWPYQIKKMAYRPYELLVGRLGATLAGIDLEKSDSLTPPWPDLILTAGRRNEAAALWIRKQAQKKVRIVHIGRPWAPLRHFDLIVTTPQYQLPRQANVHYNLLPLYRITQEKLEEAASHWQSKVTLPPPYLTVLVGGDSGPCLFDREAAGRLAGQVNRMAKEMSASVLISTSARTPLEAVSILEREITVAKQLYRFQPGGSGNPYLGFLGLAQAIVVTGDSISMLAEACATGRPVHIFPFGYGHWAMRESLTQPSSSLPFWDRRKLKAWRSSLALTFAPKRLRRDIRRMHRALIESGRAVWLGEKFAGRPPAPVNELTITAARVKALFIS